MKSQTAFSLNGSSKVKPEETIILVSGLPRSGTSMLMKMLEAGGIPILTDNLRQADEDNPKGYYELEKVKQLKDGETTWVTHAKGKAVKTISALLEYLPRDYFYKVLFMKREMSEILASQREMLVRRGEPTDRVGDDKMAELFSKHLEKVEHWLAKQTNFDVCYINYNEALANSETTIEQIINFLGLNLNREAMRKVIDPDLYRQRNRS